MKRRSFLHRAGLTVVGSGSAIASASAHTHESADPVSDVNSPQRILITSAQTDLAQEIADLQGWNLEIEPALSGEFDNTATRPRFSVLDNRVLQLDGLPLLRHWKQALHEFLDAHTCPDS